MRRSRRTSTGHAIRLLRNRLTRRRYARTALRVDDVPVAAVVVFFAAVPEELYQLLQWRPVLERVREHRPVVVVTSAPDIGRLVAQTGLPVAFAPRGADLERLIHSRRPAVVLYLNHRERNFTMLRYVETVHVYLGHGESDKGASASHQNMAYDYCFVAGRAAQDRLAAAMPLFDAVRRAPTVGRPTLDPHAASQQRPDWAVDAPGRSTVLYAPTWEGGLPSMAVGSIASHGEAIVASVLGDPGLRLVYRPHPLTGTVSPEHAAAATRIRRLVEEAGPPHLIDTGPYGWVFDIADAAVVDISSVAYDWVATGKPLLLTTPVDERARPTPSRLDSLAPMLRAQDADRTAERVRRLIESPVEGWADLVEYHFGDVRPGASIRRFLDTLDDVAVDPG